ncbi:hypothetical protein [Arcicella aquatica]|uniref:hypothetical protein n=1 Tax=Arcicella aquatica TaxID=217141 RepID=UPI0038993C3C
MIDKYEQNIETMKVIIKEAVKIYNQNRPHFSNYLLAPNQMHKQSKLKMRTYKTKNSSNKSAYSTRCFLLNIDNEIVVFESTE